MQLICILQTPELSDSAGLSPKSPSEQELAIDSKLTHQALISPEFDEALADIAEENSEAGSKDSLQICEEPVPPHDKILESAAIDLPRLPEPMFIQSFGGQGNGENGDAEAREIMVNSWHNVLNSPITITIQRHPPLSCIRAHGIDRSRNAHTHTHTHLQCHRNILEDSAL